MAGVERIPCNFCKTEPMTRHEYVNHLMSKRHHATLRAKNAPPISDVIRRSVHVAGYNQAAGEAILAAFWPHQIRDFTFNGVYTFIEFHTTDIADEVMKKKFFLGKIPLKVNRRHGNNIKGDNTSISLSSGLVNALKEVVEPQELDKSIVALVNEIELKPKDYECREYLRVSMARFLSSNFPRCSAYVFGSSANNLGFTGSDVDLYVELGVDPWAQGSKAEVETKASDLTWFLAREIRKSGFGREVKAVARARVPIVKFIHSETKLPVDLSFRHGMPVYNTALIWQYSRTHELVRPYLMLIRYWAKVQEISGGGQPSVLITNYAFTMLMLFVLMSRRVPLVPSVQQLQAFPVNRCIINGWDCGFHKNIDIWKYRNHDTTVMELVVEFFEFYATFDSQKWIVCPLAGCLIEREKIQAKNASMLPPCLQIYCSHNVDLQSDTALCVQDPFEQSHNITRGLKENALREFQIKCKKSLDIGKKILKGDDSLHTLLQPIEVSAAEMKANMRVENKEKENEIDKSKLEDANKSQEIITLDDSDDEEKSQDCIAILDLPKKEIVNLGYNNAKPSTSLTAKAELEIITVQEESSQGSVEEVAVTASSSTGTVNNRTINTNGANTGIDDNSNPVSHPFKFTLNFEKTPEFSITVDGNLSGGKQEWEGSESIGEAASSLVQFIMQQCLKVETSLVDCNISNKKRKSQSPLNEDNTNKRQKVNGGESVVVVSEFHRVAQYECCISGLELWIGRKKISKTVPKLPNQNPLIHELKITEAQMQQENLIVDDSTHKFLLNVWQEHETPSKFMVSAETPMNEATTRKKFMPLFLHFSSMSQNLLKKVVNYVKATSTKV